MCGMDESIRSCSNTGTLMAFNKRSVLPSAKSWVESVFTRAAFSSGGIFFVSSCILVAKVQKEWEKSFLI